MDEWIRKTFELYSKWRPLLSKAAESENAAHAFVAEHGEEWKEVVAEQFGAEARKALLELDDTVRRSQILKSIVSIVDLTKRLEDPDSLPGGLTLAFLQIQAELQRMHTRLKRLAGVAGPKPATAPKEDKAAAEPRPSSPPPRLRRRSTLPPPRRRKDAGAVGTKKPKAKEEAWTDEGEVGSEAPVASVDREPQEEVPETSGPVIPIEPEDLVEEQELDELASEMTTQPIVDEPAEAQAARPAAEVEPRSEFASGPRGAAVHEEGGVGDGDLSLEETVDMAQAQQAPAEPDMRAEEPVAAGEPDAEVEIRPVDLLDDEVLDQPVLPLKKKKEGSGLVNVADVVDVPSQVAEEQEAEPTAEPDQEDEVAEEPEVVRADEARIALLESFVARLKEAETITPSLDSALDMVVSVLSSVTPANEEELAHLLATLDEMCLQPEGSTWSEDQRRRALQELSGLSDAVRRRFFSVLTGTKLQGIELSMTPVATHEDASELPAARLARRLAEGLSRWRLPTDLLRLRGPALVFHVRVAPKKGVPLALPVPANSLEFGIAADRDEVYVFALGLLSPSEERPLGLGATSGRPGAGVFHAIRIPRPPLQRHLAVAERFGLAELGRFLKNVRRYLAH